MLKVALTGNRFSGKDSVAREFEKIGVQVFHADPIIKFILNYRTDFEPFIKKDKSLGDKIFTQGFIDPNKIKTTEQFEKLLEIVEFELFSAYDNWSKKFTQGSVYTIFHSSILFEKDWDQYFDKVINVFTPREDRLQRIALETNMPIAHIYSLLDTEISEFKKNDKSTYTIHAYRDLVDQVCKCDSKIVDSYLELKEIESKSKQPIPKASNSFVM